MHLELATVVDCDDTGCRVQLIETSEEVTAAYSEKVKGVIRIRQKQLVAINTEVQPPEISWRWNIGEVESIEGTTIQVRRLDLPAGQTEEVSNGDGMPVRLGDLVFYAHGEEGTIVSHVANGRPTDVAALKERHLLAVTAFLTS